MWLPSASGFGGPVASNEARRAVADITTDTEAIAKAWAIAVEMKELLDEVTLEPDDVNTSLRNAMDRWVAALNYWQACRAAALGWNVSP